MTHQIDPATQTLSFVIPGDILSTNVDALRAEIFGALENPEIKTAQWQMLKLDLASAQMIDSAGLNLLVTIIRAAKARGSLIHATVSSANLHRTLIFTRLDQQMTIEKK